MSRKSVTDAVDKAEHRRRSKKLKQRLNTTSSQRLFIFLSAIAITLISFIYAGLYNDKHGGKAAPGSLTVAIDQKTGTADANPSYTSVFTVQFNEAIDESTFTDSDITLGGTAPGQQVQSITEAGTFNKTTYEVRIQATSAGTITPTIAQELITAQNIASGTNQVSTSTDNSVTYNGDWGPGEFVTKWKTDNPGVSGSNQITIPTNGGGYNYSVDWGDGNTSTGQTGNSTHTYASIGTYTVSITGTFPRIEFNNNGDRQKILTIEQWGVNPWVSVEYAFMGCANLSIPATDAPDFSLLTSLDTMFANSTNLNSNLNHWDINHITSTDSVFKGASSFNQPLNSWDVGNVTNMASMFSGASAFNQPLNSWDVGNVTNMWGVFYNATSFNQPLDNWDVGNVTSMNIMFSGASSFNQPLNNWNTGSVTSIGGIFTGASAFNQPLNNWNTGNVTYMGNAFKNATSFNQPLNNWDVSHVTNTDSMFSGASSFNQPLNNWNTGNITFMYGMFKNTSSFNQSLAAWDVSNVTGTTGMYDMLNYTALSVANYDATLIGWSSQNLKNGVHLNAFSRKYCTSAAERQSIITNHSWTITDGGQDCASTRAPQVDTNSATSITQNSTTLNGVTSPDTITDRGFQYGPTNSYGSIATDSSATITTYGSQGSGNGQFGFAYGVATDSSGNVYVADSANHRIQKFDANGNFLMKFGTNGSGNGQLNAPDDISIDSSSNIYVADSLNHRIQKFDSNGTYLSQFGTNGSGNGQFNTPASITFDTSGNIYVADQDNHRIQKFDSNGTYLSQFGTNGSGNGQFANPHGVTVDTSGNIYVADTNNHRIQKFDSSGAYVSKWGSAGNGDGQFNYPSNTAIDKDGNVYVMDFFNHRVQKFSNNGFYISQFGSGGSGLTEFTFPHDLAFSPNGNLYTQDNLGYRLKRYVGTITANISGLTCGTSYHYRAYATNSYGTGYGDDQTFTTSACAPEPFIMRVKTDNPGVSGNNQYTIPTNTGYYTYNYNVDCNNDGTPEHTNQTGNVTCTYGSPGTYDIAITGTFPHLKNDTNITTDTEKITDVRQWGDIVWQDMSEMFYDATNITTFTATDIPDLSNVTDTSWMFTNATNFNTNINNWNVSNVTDMDAMFSVATSFNQPLNNWDVSNVTYTSFMFDGASSFNQPLNNWDVSSVIFMVGMFDHATNFNQALSSWNVSSVTDMVAIFRGATSFNQPLNNWNVSNVTDMSYVFDGATSFNQPLNNWNVSNVTSMFSMFARASSFNQDINNWNVSNVTNLGYIFNGAVAFNQPLNSWDVSNVTSMSGAFMNAASFNQPLNNWDVSNVTLMHGMFSAAFNFNQPLNNWDVSNVVGMSNMFTSASSFNQDINNWSVSNVTSMSGVFMNAVSFNQPLNNWNVSNVTDMSGLFVNATSFDQSLASWNVSNVTAMPIMFGDFVQIYRDAYEQYYGLPYVNWLQADKDNFWAYISSTLGYPVDESYTPNPSGLSMSNYDSTLIAWSGQNLESNVIFHVGNSQYCASEAQRQSIITNFTWTIIDAGKDCGAPPQQPFIMRVKTDNLGVSSNNQYTIPTNSGNYTYNYNVDCNNDGTPEHSNQTGDVTCTYGSTGEYDIAITGIFPHLKNDTNTVTDTEKIIDVKQWGDIAWQDMSGMFYNATNITTFTATDIPDLSQVTHMSYMFYGASNFNSDIDNWDVSNVMDMSFMFKKAYDFNQPLNNWDVSNVMDMSYMFSNATSFNQALNNWNVGNVISMDRMFGWDANNETDVFATPIFNQDISSWDVSSLIDMSGMFFKNANFNQPLNNWDVSNATDMELVFAHATSFNQPLSSWDVSNSTDMEGMFANTPFNQPLNNWNVSNVTDMEGMFVTATLFNQPLNSWDVSNVADMTGMFSSATSFNQPLDNWDVSNVATMQLMFGNYVIYLFDMFAPSPGMPYNDWPQVNKDIANNNGVFQSLNIDPETFTDFDQYDAGLSTPNYDATLIAWSALNLESSVTFDAGTSKYCDAETQRQNIITNFTWTINDAGKNCATAPSAPLSPSITEVTSSSMKLNWSPPADDGGSAITSYQVQYKASSSGTWISAPVQGPSPTTHVLTNLSPNTSYDFRVAAINAIGASPYTSPVSATTLTPSTPSPSPSPSVTPDPTPTPTTTVTPTPDPEVPTTDTRTNTPVPGTPVYKPKPSATPAPQRVQDGSSSFTEKLRGYIGALGPSASYAPASLLILLVALAIFYLYQTWREQQVYTHLDKLLRRYRVSKQLRADFVNLSSHYLNTPLQIMRGSLELAQTALPHMAHEIKVIAASLEIMSHDTASLLQANQDSTEASASLVQLDKQDLPHLMRRTGVWLPVVSTVALMLIFEIVILVVGRMGLNPYTVGVFICLTIFAGLMVLFTYRARWRLRSLNKQAQAALNFERNIDSQRVSFMETTTKELNDQIDAMRLPAEKLLATGQAPTFANGYAMLGQVATKLSQITTVGQVSAETALTPLKPWLESHLPVMTEYVESQGMKFNSKIEPNLAVNLTREALAQIVSSLIGNAVKFSKAGAEIRLTIAAQGDMIHLSVQDTGVGIAKDKLTQLMQPFARGTDVLAYDYEGIGLSLYLDRLITERVGGELTMQSVVGKGTTVSLLLPRAGK